MFAFLPLVSLQSTACSTAFSSGSPTKLSSRKASEWHEASTYTVSSGASQTAQTSSSSLQVKDQAIKHAVIDSTQAITVMYLNSFE